MKDLVRQFRIAEERGARRALWIGRLASLVVAGILVAAAHYLLGMQLSLVKFIALSMIMPLALIWFPGPLGRYRGFLDGQYINVTTPAPLVAAAGWFLLFGFPLLLWWINSHVEP
ncbi:MAG: hypothetical protein K1X57_13400 [Gemmataceae bacterium]|nr:hypothetical protein [Gemmataceae bacterium]